MLAKAIVAMVLTEDVQTSVVVHSMAVVAQWDLLLVAVAVGKRDFYEYQKASAKI